ncbi:hypothetical protein B0I35DRAFT_411124 [Stachybotrys elegans]|uniref:Riboflavin kinase n=1 Tax=Stachybotrys elegans TaxID=80388 RepID=A0A8K0SHI3_9HYPO|nr:hypothetical protein B0I35DRAFT_411124 [Stachybotrys elegans]
MPGRPEIVGPESGPEPPFPYRMADAVIMEKQRGRNDLGVRTANLDIHKPPSAYLEAPCPPFDDIPSGIYFGYASVALPASHPDKPPGAAPGDFTVYPMAMSIGYNPHYGNKERSAEVHFLHNFELDFYGSYMRVLILGFIREERKYDSTQELIDDIMFDIKVTKKSLSRTGWSPKQGQVVWHSKTDDGSPAPRQPDEDENYGNVDGKLDISWLVEPLPPNWDKK